MQRMLLALRSGLLLLALLSQTATATGLKVYQSRIIYFGESAGVEQWEVEGVATVELVTDESNNAPAFMFVCNTTANNGEEIQWVTDVGPIDQTSLSNGKRLEFGRPNLEDLGVYYCFDQATHEQVALNITDANPAVCAVDNQKAVVIGQSVELEVYVSGIPPIISSWITWFGPDGNALTESNAAFRNNRRKLVLDNVQNSSSGVYKCQVDIPDSSTASDAIKLEVYLPSVITQDPQSLIGVEEWSEVILSCTATGHPLPTISWERESRELPVFFQTNSVESDGKVVSMLTIGTVRYMDMGRYRCSADNTETAVVFSQYAELSVSPSLRLVATVNNNPTQFTNLLFVEEGSTVTVECHGTGTLVWSSSTGFNISSDDLDQIYQEPDHSRGVQTLHIQSFSDSALSTYTCTTDFLDSTNDHLHRALFITNSNPAVFIAEETLYVLQDTTATITVNIIAHPAVDSIEWFHEGSLVDPEMDTRFSISDDRRELSINNVEESVLGTYEVVATIETKTARDSVIIAIPDLAAPTAIGTFVIGSADLENGTHQGVESNCSVKVEDCPVVDTDSSSGVKLIILILAPVGGILLVAIATVLICIVLIRCYCLKKMPRKPLTRSTGSLYRVSVSKSNNKTITTASTSNSPSIQRPLPYTTAYFPDTIVATSGTESTRYTVLRGPCGSVSALSQPTEREDSLSRKYSDRPWYEMDYNFSISSNTRLADDINPYATTHNSAIPYDHTASRSRISRSRASSLPCNRNTARRLPAPSRYADTATAVLSTEC